MSTDGSSTLRVEVAGDPDHPLVVLVHGSMDRSAGMIRLSRRLSDSFRVLRYDRRGYERSIGVGPPFTLDAHIDDLIAVMDQHAPGRTAALLFGHSFGGNVVLGVADRRPDMVDAVAVYETPLSWLEWWPGNSAGGTALASSDAADAAEAFMRRLVGDRIWERLPAGTRAARRSEGAAMVGELGDLRRGAPWNPKRIEAPLLAARGEHASPHHQRGAATLIEMVSHARLHVLADADHGAPNSHAGELAEALRAFVSSNDG